MVHHTSRIILFLLLFSSFAGAQQVTIHGKADSYLHKEITAFGYQDYITWTRETIATDTVSSSGVFTLHFNVKEASRIYLFCDHMKTPLYVEPGRTYEVDFPRKDSTRLLNANVDQDGDLNIHPIPGKMKGSIDTTELNWLIIDYNLRYEDFWKKNYQSFVIKRMRAPLDSFRRAMNTHYAPIRNPYFKTFMDYTIASTQVSTLESQNFIFRDYLQHRKIEYRNYEYMTFFNQFFDKYFYEYTLKPGGASVLDAINQKGDEGELMSALKTAPYLGNDTLRELLLLKGLYENYNNKEFNRHRMMQILEEVSKKSKIPEHRLIARNIIARFTVLKRGTDAPAFTLPDKAGKMVSLSDYKGKYVYLCFGKSNSPSCISDFLVLEEVNKKYPLIQVVSIMTDDNAEELKKLLKQNPKFRWTFLEGGNQEELKHKYSIYSEPYYFLIGPTGKLLLSPAPGPYDGLEEIFYDITKKKEDRFKVGE